MAIAAIAVILLFHELIHFAFMKIFYRGKVRLVFARDGLGLPTPGVSVEGSAKKWQEIIMRIAPFVFLTVLPDFLFAFASQVKLFFFIIALGNSAGCYFDIMDICRVFGRKNA